MTVNNVDDLDYIIVHGNVTEHYDEMVDNMNFHRLMRVSCYAYYHCCYYCNAGDDIDDYYDYHCYNDNFVDDEDMYLVENYYYYYYGDRSCWCTR